ncbi:FxSxx-COOH system tetratricopeptide repeat protein [Streptomyces sp. NBC_00140]|uniref:FxSxx-COOH system tetratricopeptide repeat protein n=1 Tax=Streptomyces sp. NBC_00140 TaxID=2975664 RepID=UPI00225445FE|nr:FxSxx-COOH system tetratricopeptide repeat protein [Streptomyces sp. NBC_00140]MCX5330648.1 FxSxx-COOH system tetratricopeptide repeat protein [Streptomyces sp. NBC_00140]
MTISYAGFNRPWATWIAHQLEQLGHETTLLRWAPPLRMPLAEALRNLLQAPGRVLLVLDDWYFSLGPRSDAEWTEALHEVVPAHVDRFSAVSVATRALPATAAPLRPVDLRDLDSREARRRILRRLDIEASAEPAAASGTAAPRFPNDPPSVWNVTRRNVRFTGRDAILEELHARFERGGRSGARVALRGISGVGKSQIANEYSHCFGNDYDVVWWVGARFRAPAREQFAQLAPRLELPVGQQLGERIRAVHEALRTGTPYKRWLLILDSADDMEQIEDLLPEGNGHVLITTSTQDWAASGNVTEIEVLPFRRPESVAYVRRRAQRLNDAEADQLADAVQDLPLLLAQTAAWLDANAMPAKDYISMIRRGEASQIGIRISSDYPMGFQTSWSITLNTLQENNPEAVELLHLFALFSPDAIPVRLMQAARPSDLPDHLAALAGDPIRWYTALRRLSESTAVRLDYVESTDAEPAVDRVSMHRLYHSFLVSTLAEERREALSTIACRLLAGADPRRPADTREWTRYAELIPHLETAGVLDSSDPVVRQLVLNCIEYMRVRGENHTALRLCEQAVTRWRIRLRPEDRDMLILIHDHANMLRRSGRYLEAEAVGRAVHDQLAETRAGDDADLLRAKNGLAGTLVSQGRYDEANQMFAECVEAYSRTLGPEAPRTLQDRGNLAVVTSLLGRFGESLGMHRDILLIRERQLGPRHHLTQRSGMFTAWMLRLVGHYPEATARQELNVRAHRQMMDRFTPQTLLAEHNLALCMAVNGDLEPAGALMRGVVERFVQRQGPSHPDSLLVQADLAMLGCRLGGLEEALGLATTVADEYAALVGPAHPYAVGTSGNVAFALGLHGDASEALRRAEQALRGMRAAVGPAHPWTLGAQLNAGRARKMAGDEEGAAELSGEVLESARIVMGETHPLTLLCAAARADDLRALRRPGEAAELEGTAYQRLSEGLGPGHPHALAVRRGERPFWAFEPLPT